MILTDGSHQSLLKLADTLGELEIVIGDKARPVVAELRARLIEAAASREKGDMPAAVNIIHRAMDRLAELAGQLDPAEGMLMRLIADRFSRALAADDKGTVKDAVSLMRNRAGDKDDDKFDW